MDIDLEDILDLRQSAGHQAEQIRMLEAIHALGRKLEEPGPDDNTHYLRGQIKGLRTALAIPEILENEARNNGKKS